MSDTQNLFLHPIYKEAIQTIDDAMKEAKALMVNRGPVNIASLATVGENYKPSVRTVTICDVSEQGILFFINGNSGKAMQIRDNPHVGLCFYWDALPLQLIVQGAAIETSRDDAIFWWNKQNRHFQLAAWSSAVDEPQERASIKERFSDQRVPLPGGWKAYRVKPEYVESWRVNWKKTNERCLYALEGEQWIKDDITRP